MDRSGRQSSLARASTALFSNHSIVLIMIPLALGRRLKWNMIASLASPRSCIWISRSEAGTGGSPGKCTGLLPRSLKLPSSLDWRVGNKRKAARAEAPLAKKKYEGRPSSSATSRADVQNMSSTSARTLEVDLIVLRKSRRWGHARRRVSKWTTTGGLEAAGETTLGRRWKEMDGYSDDTREMKGALVMETSTGGSTTTMVTEKPWPMKSLASSTMGIMWPIPTDGKSTTDSLSCILLLFFG
ncbi:anthocyanidin 5,3-O-glucosyltransferase-like [Iris pallida]|uniref:Anthocyanidin 5,3-O-glucosyltransferase-like n=1 Tax=Iris pallida TaxID=29817 RepID=A0AAX6E237_IRIPA|nr:anthocyanidin 5,3-O-glucosyltransferase-like [Iris pallida]